jgi:TnpA family transposase
MPVSFLSMSQRESYGRFTVPPSQDEIAQFFHLNDDDLTHIACLRGDHNRLGFALQLTTVRFLGVFLDNPVAVPAQIIQTPMRQLGITTSDCIQAYHEARRHQKHALEIRSRYGYRDFSAHIVLDFG